MNITDKLLTPGVNHGRSGRTLVPQGIVIHYVGNPKSTAIANRNWFESGANGANTSAHYIIGLDGEIIRCLPDNEQAAHAGVSYGPQWNEKIKYNNSKLIGIECCHPDADGKFNSLTTASLIELVRMLCEKYGLDPDKHVYRHYDVCGKQCPMYYVKNPAAWDELKRSITDAVSGINILVDKLYNAGYITDKVHWQNVLDGKTPANPAYLKILFERVVK